MHQSRMNLDRRVGVVLVRDGLRCQTLNVEALCRLQQRRQLRVIHADFAAINKLQESLQVARRNAGQHYNWMLACRVLRMSKEKTKIKSHFHAGNARASCERGEHGQKEWVSESRQHFTATAHAHRRSSINKKTNRRKKKLCSRSGCVCGPLRYRKSRLCRASSGGKKYQRTRGKRGMVEWK